MNYKMNWELLAFTVCLIPQGAHCPEGIRNRSRLKKQGGFLS